MRCQGSDSMQICHLTSTGNPIVEIRWSSDCLISTMLFPLLVRWHLYIESGSRPWAAMALTMQDTWVLAFHEGVYQWPVSSVKETIKNNKAFDFYDSHDCNYTVICTKVIYDVIMTRYIFSMRSQNLELSLRYCKLYGDNQNAVN